MKKVVAGGFFLLSGALLYVGVHLAAVLHLPNMDSWSTPPGRYGTALRETGGYAFSLISILFMIIGFLMMIIELYFSKAVLAYKAALAQRNREYEQENSQALDSRKE